MLEITFIGFDRADVPVAGKSAIGDVSLTPATVSLNQVVVTGYTSKKSGIYRSVSVVNVAI